MELFFDKLDIYIRQKKMTYNELCQQMGIGRTTLWGWKKNKRKPKEIHIRAIARVLNLPVNKISDLPEEILISERSFSEEVFPVIKSLNNSTFYNDNEFDTIFNRINNLRNKLFNADNVIRGLTDSIDFIFYVKDINMKYILANKGFLKNLSLNRNYLVIGKKDIDFFSQKEAKLNEEEDRKVLLSGKSIINKETYIFGSKKKKWGLISKYPIFDAYNKIQGIVVVQIDISNRKREERIRELLEINVDAMTTGLILMDIKNKKYIYMNKSIERITGYPISYLLNLKPSEFAKLLFKSDNINKISFEELYSSDSNINTEVHRIIAKNGHEKSVSVTRSRKVFQNKDCTVNLIKEISETKDNEVSWIQIVKNLKNLNVDSSIISKATNLSKQQIFKL